MKKAGRTKELKISEMKRLKWKATCSILGNMCSSYIHFQLQKHTRTSFDWKRFVNFFKSFRYFPAIENIKYVGTREKIPSQLQRFSFMTE